jgi:hypothetical protein
MRNETPGIKSILIPSAFACCMAGTVDTTKRAANNRGLNMNTPFRRSGLAGFIDNEARSSVYKTAL